MIRSTIAGVLLALALTCATEAAPVQIGSNQASGTSTSTLSVSATGNITAGDMVWVAACVDGNFSITGVSDMTVGGDTFTLGNEFNYNTNIRCKLAWAVAAANITTPIITVTVSGSTTALKLALVADAPSLNTNEVNQAVNGSTSSTHPSYTTPSLVQATQTLINISAWRNAATVSSEDSNSTSLGSVTDGANATMHWAYRPVTSATGNTYTYTSTITSSANWADDTYSFYNAAVPPSHLKTTTGYGR